MIAGGLDVGLANAVVGPQADPLLSQQCGGARRSGRGGRNGEPVDIGEFPIVTAEAHAVDDATLVVISRAGAIDQLANEPWYRVRDRTDIIDLEFRTGPRSGSGRVQFNRRHIPGEEMATERNVFVALALAENGGSARPLRRT